MSSNEYLDITLIDPHPMNPRKTLGDLDELTASIVAQKGILEPLLVQPHPLRAGRYRVLAGHRRLKAGKNARLEMVPVRVRYGVSDAQALEMMLVENCQRLELGPMEKAEAMGSLLSQGYTRAKISQRTGLAESTISTYLKLLELDAGSRDLVRAGVLPVAEAVAAIRATNRKAGQRAGGKRTRSGTGPRRTWTPDHLTDRHPLARAAARLCDDQDHTMSRRIGDTACGRCWEEAIRADERAKVTTQATGARSAA